MPQDHDLGFELRSRLQVVAPIAHHGHPRQAHRPRLALAERLRRKADRIDPTRVRRPSRCLRRSALTPDSGSLGGRPRIAADLRALIRRMSAENPLWRAPRMHGELLKLGFEVAQSSVAKYMVNRCGLPSQGWRTFLRNHAPDIAAMDLFVVPTVGFDLLYGLVIVRLGRRDLV